MIDKYLNLGISGYKALLQNKDIAAVEKLPKLTPAGLAIVRHKGLKERKRKERKRKEKIKEIYNNLIKSTICLS